MTKGGWTNAGKIIAIIIADLNNHCYFVFIPSIFTVEQLQSRYYFSFIPLTVIIHNPYECSFRVELYQVTDCQAGHAKFLRLLFLLIVNGLDDEASAGHSARGDERGNAQYVVVITVA